MTMLRAYVALLGLSGCVAVLDLDARGDGEDGEPEGGSTGAIAGGGTDEGGAGGQLGVGGEGGELGVGGQLGVGGEGGGGVVCDDPSALFSGEQLMIVDNPDHTALDYDDRITIGAWLRVDPAGAADQYIFSRLDEVAQKGYALHLRKDNGRYFPEIRLFVDGRVCGCSGAIEIVPDRWTHVAGAYAKDHIAGKDAGVWVDGQRACIVECGAGKLAKFPAKPVIGAKLDGTSGFFSGRIDDLYVRNSDQTPPPQLDGGACEPDLVLFLPFDTAISEGSAPTCGSDHLTLTLGKDAFLGPDEPSWEGCP